MCHSSCLTCTDQLFTSCTSCAGTNVLYSGVCYCSSAWNSDCTQQLMFEDVFKFGDSILRVSFLFIVILYCLKVKLPISYRFISGMQGLALLIYSSNMYLDYEDFFVLKTFNFLSGPYQLKYRLQNLSNEHTKQIYYLLAFFFVLFIIFYYPTKTFIKKSQLDQQSSSYFTYLKNCSFPFLENFYYFGSKFMWYFIGLFIVQNDNSISIIISMSIFCLICLISMGKVFYDYHYDQIDQSVFSSSFYIYSILSSAIFIGLPLISKGQSNMLLLIYCLPIGVLILVFLLNKQTKIFNRNTIKFIIVQVLMVIISIVFILLSSMIQSFILLALIFVCLLVILVQSTILYYGGIQFDNSKKVMPLNANNNQNAQNTLQEIHPNQNMNKNRNDHFF